MDKDNDYLKIRKLILNSAISPRDPPISKILMLMSVV